MKALRWHGAKDLRVETVALPELKDDQVRIAVKWCGICGSDLHEYVGGPIVIPVDQPNPLTGEKAPLIMGHEFAGEVIETGKNTSRFKVGDRVTVEPIISPWGYHGKYNLNPGLGFVGLMGGGGGFSEQLCVNEYQVYHLPEEVSYEQGALAEPAAVGLYAVSSSTMKVGDRVAVLGCGPIGLLVIESLLLAGARNVYAVEMSPERRAVAQSMGDAVTVIDPSACNAVEAIRDLSSGGVDVTFEVTGVPPVFNQALEMTKSGGEIMVVSLWEKNVEFNLTSLVLTEKRISGVAAYRNMFPKVLGLMNAGNYLPKTYVTSKINLDNAVEDGFEKLTKSKTEIKILVSPE